MVEYASGLTNGAVFSELGDDLLVDRFWCLALEFREHLAGFVAHCFFFATCCLVGKLPGYVCGLEECVLGPYGVDLFGKFYQVSTTHCCVKSGQAKCFGAGCGAVYRLHTGFEFGLEFVKNLHHLFRTVICTRFWIELQSLEHYEIVLLFATSAHEFLTGIPGAEST